MITGFLGRRRNLPQVGACARYGGTIDKFTGDGIMAVFGAPVALEDHAVRACLAGLAIQEEAKQLALDVRVRDGVELSLRVGLNSGQVIAGEIGSGPFGAPWRVRHCHTSGRLAVHYAKCPRTQRQVSDNHRARCSCRCVRGRFGRWIPAR
jgi:Adenylate and Guanylate cyclase catalytic domain